MDRDKQPVALMPTSMQSIPATNVGFIFRVQVMKSPANTLHNDTPTSGDSKTSPEVVGVTCLTAWRKRGTLNKIVDVRIDPSKLDQYKLPFGDLVNKFSGSIGRVAFLSTGTKATAAIAETINAAKTTGWVQVSTFPPKLMPTMNDEMPIVSTSAPAKSKVSRALTMLLPCDLASDGPKSFGVAANASPDHVSVNA